MVVNFNIVRGGRNSENTLTKLKNIVPLGQFQPNLAQSILGWGGFKFLKMKGSALYQGEIITKYKNTLAKFKKPLCIFGWRGFKFVQMKGPVLFPRGDNYEIVKIYWRNLKILFSWTTELISNNLVIKHPLVKGIQISSNEEPINSHKVNNGFFS